MLHVLFTRICKQKIYILHEPSFHTLYLYDTIHISNVARRKFVHIPPTLYSREIVQSSFFAMQGLKMKTSMVKSSDSIIFTSQRNKFGRHSLPAVVASSCEHSLTSKTKEHHHKGLKPCHTNNHIFTIRIS